MNIKERLLDDLNFDSDISYEDVAAVPDNFEGDYSIPCFKLAKKYKKSPALIAKDFAESYVAKGLVKKVFVVGPYINVVFNRAEVAEISLLMKITEEEPPVSERQCVLIIQVLHFLSKSILAISALRLLVSA